MLLPGPGLTVALLTPSEAALCPEPCLVPENAPTPPPPPSHTRSHAPRGSRTNLPPCSWAAGHQMPKGHPVREVLSRPLPSQTPPSLEPLSVSSLMKGKRNRQDFLRAAPRSSPSPVSALSPDVRRPGPPAFAAAPARAHLSARAACPPPLPSLPSDGVPSPPLLRPSPRDSSLGMLHPARIPERDGAGNTALRCALRGHSFQTSKPSAMATVRTYFICNSFEYKTGNDTDCFTF